MQEDTYYGDGLNLYEYCRNNPMLYRDPSGHDVENQKNLYKNVVYRAINQKDYDRLMQGLGLEAKNPNGNWTLEEHLVNGSSKTSWSNDPFISTTSDLNVAKGFNQSGSRLGIVVIDLDKITTSTYKGYEIFPRVNGVKGLPYHYSI